MHAASVDTENPIHVLGASDRHSHREGAIGIGCSVCDFTKLRVDWPESHRDRAVGRKTTGNDLDRGS